MKLRAGFDLASRFFAPAQTSSLRSRGWDIRGDPLLDRVYGRDAPLGFRVLHVSHAVRGQTADMPLVRHDAGAELASISFVRAWSSERGPTIADCTESE